MRWLLSFLIVVLKIATCVNKWTESSWSKQQLPPTKSTYKIGTLIRAMDYPSELKHHFNGKEDGRNFF